MKKTRIVDQGAIKFKIEHDDGETLESLAINLAEALSAKSYYDAQSHAFLLQSQNERRKGQELINLLFDLKKYNRDKKNGLITKISRMEPMETYDPNIIEQEKTEYMKRANDFHQKFNEYTKLSEKEQRNINTIQGKLNKARNGSAG